MTTGVGPSHKKLMVLDSQADFPESLLLMAVLDASNNFPQEHLRSLDVQAQSTPNSAPDQSSQKPKLLDQDVTTKVSEADMGQLQVRQKAIQRHAPRPLTANQSTLQTDPFTSSCLCKFK
jgi:hypothetical protein